VPRDDDPFTDLRDDHEGVVDSIIGMPEVAPDLEPFPTEIEVAFQPRELVGSYPVAVTAARLDGDGIRVDLLMERMGRGETRPLSVLLVNRPPDATPLSAPSASSMTHRPRPVQTVTAPRDLPAAWYGIVGITGGVSIGLLSAYLLGWVVG
jgi:hypothetical protein